MAFAPTPNRGRSLPATIGRMLVVPLCLGAAAIAIAASLGHVSLGLLATVGLLLGAANGVVAQVTTARLLPDPDVTKGAIVSTSLRRLGLVSAVAFLIAFLARPDGWIVLLGLAVYQLLSLGSAFGAAMRQARRA